MQNFFMVNAYKWHFFLVIFLIRLAFSINEYTIKSIHSEELLEVTTEINVKLICGKTRVASYF